MSKENLRVETRFVHDGHGLGLAVTPHNGTNGVHGAHYVLPTGARLVSPNRPPSETIQVNGTTFRISFQAARGDVKALSPDEDGKARLFFSSASVEGLEIADVTDDVRDDVRLEASRVSAGALSKSFPPIPDRGGPHARPGKDGKEFDPDPFNRIEGLKLDGFPVQVNVDRTPLHLFPTLKGLREAFKKDDKGLRKRFGHRFLHEGRSLPRDKVFATLADLIDRNQSRKGFSQAVCANPRAAGRNNVIYLDGFGRLELGVAWRSSHALRIQMLRIVFDPTVEVEGHEVKNEGMYPLRKPFSHAAQQPNDQQEEANANAPPSQESESEGDSEAEGLEAQLPQAQMICADVESCGGNYPPTKQ